MKVLHVIPSVWAGDGGPAHALMAMERALAAAGIEVETATTDDDGPGRHNGAPLGVPVAQDGVTRWYFRKRFDFYKPAVGLRDWLHAQVRRFDLVHTHALFSHAPVLAARTARAAGVPYVMRPLGTLDAWSLAHRRPLLKRASLRWIEGPILRDAAAVHFTSDEEARQAAAVGIDWRARVLPLGVPVADEPATRSWSGAPTILYLSRLAPKKNVEGLLDAMALLAREGSDVRLRIAGDGDADYVRSLRQRAQAAGLASNVSWLGRLEGEAKARAMATSDVFVLPSHSENFGVAAAEALAAGLPCVLGAGVAIAQEVAEAAAGVCVGTTPAEIAQGLRLMMDEQRRAAMSRSAWRLAQERYSLQAMARNLKRLYEDILNGNHGPGPH